MKRMCSLLLALALSLSLCACGAQPRTPPEAPSSGSVPPPPEPSEPENIPPEPEGVPEPEEPPLDITPADGVAYKSLFAWPDDGSSFWHTLPAEDGRVLVGRTKPVGEGGHAYQLLGINMEKGELDFTLPLTETEGIDIRKALAAPGEFIVADAAGCRRYGWTEKGVEEKGSYTLPPFVVEKIAAWVKAEESLRSYSEVWDVRPEEDVLAWIGEEGIWLSEADGSGAHLAIPMEEIYQRPEYEDYPEVKRAFVGEDVRREDCVRIASLRLMNGGRSLAVPVYNRVSPWWNDDILVVDIGTGKRTWYDGVFFQMGQSSLDYLDDRTIQVGYTRIDTESGTTQPTTLWDEEVLFQAAGITSDFVNYYSIGKREQTELGHLELGAPGPPPVTLEEKSVVWMELFEQTKTALTFGDEITWPDFIAVDGKRLLLQLTVGKGSEDAYSFLIYVTCP